MNTFFKLLTSALFLFIEIFFHKMGDDNLHDTNSLCNNIVNDLGKCMSNVFSFLIQRHLLEPSPHTLKQRKWRANRKNKPYSTRSHTTSLFVEQIVSDVLILY